MDGDTPFKFGRLHLGGIVLACFCVAYYAGLRPLRLQAAQVQTAITEARRQITESRAKVDAIQDLQRKAARARDELQSLDNDLPPGPSVVWIPQLVKAHFGRFGFANLNTVLKLASDEPGLPGYQRMHWIVAVPISDVTKQADNLFAAVAALDQSQAVLHVVDLEIPREGDEAGKGIARVRFSMIARK